MLGYSIPSRRLFLRGHVADYSIGGGELLRGGGEEGCWVFNSNKAGGAVWRVF